MRRRSKKNIRKSKLLTNTTIIKLIKTLKRDQPQWNEKNVKKLIKHIK